MNIIKTLTSQAIPGMIVAEDIYTKDHYLIIAKDTVLTDKIITRLKFYSITDFYIYCEDNLVKEETEYFENTFYTEIKKANLFVAFISHTKIPLMI